KASQSRPISSRKILRQLLRARMLPGCFPADAAGAASISPIGDDRPAGTSDPLFQAFLFFRGYYAFSVGGSLLYGRSAYPQQQNRLRLSCRFLSALHHLWASLTQRTDSPWEKPSRSFSA